MYDWLDGTLDDATCVITANRRLTRLLLEEWARSRVAAGETAWRTPEIRPWQGWLGSVAAAAVQEDVPTRINPHQSQVLWEHCLRKELGDAVSGLPALVRLARETWQRLADARVGIREVARTALSDDQRRFAAAAGRYLAVLENERWVDDAGLGELVLSLIGDRRVPLRQRYVFVGFDARRAIVEAVQANLRDAGCEVIAREPADAGATPVVREFEQRDAEMRSAGAWARGIAEGNPEARVAIIVQGLDKTADRDLRLVREGFAPGWQYGPAGLRDAVNVSYGKRLGEYPAIAVALLVLRWLVRTVSSNEISMLLLSPLVGSGEHSSRARLELHVRQLPDRAWTPSMLTAALRGRGDGADDWLARIAAFSKRRRELPARARPAEWALLADDVLSGIGWPGTGAQGSDSFQLVNRWRELLNEFARLEIVSPAMGPLDAIRRLEIMAGETLFQPESRESSVQLMGPLEAAGAEFDAVWICGLTAENWPPASGPSALVSRQLQRDHAMPDATPEDTRQFAALTLQRLLGAAPEIVCSYSLIEDDAEQTISDLLGEVTPVKQATDPGWHAAGLAASVGRQVADDGVPPVTDERIYGGAGTVQRQLSEPFSAFAYGRLGVQPLDRQALGVPPSLRGQLVHDALFRLYQALPSATTLRETADDALQDSVRQAVDGAMQRHERNSDPVLSRLLGLERARIESILVAFVKLDRERADFEVAAIEGELEFRRGPLRLRLRFDRIDRFPDGNVEIIDYKTGRARKLLKRDGSVEEAQLFVYAEACAEPVVAVALANIDARETGFSGAGRGYTDEADWPELLEAIGEEIARACDEFIAGDVRLIERQGAAKARRLNLLSRYTELRNDA